MNFSTGLSLFTNLVLKNLGSLFGCHTDSSIWTHNTISFSNLAAMTAMISAVTFSNYIAHILGNL